MILEFIISALFGLIKTFFNFSLPLFPEYFMTAFYDFLDMMFDNFDLIGFFVRWDTIKLAIPVLLAILAADKIYHIVMWILKKIPVLGIS